MSPKLYNIHHTGNDSPLIDKNPTVLEIRSGLLDLQKQNLSCLKDFTCLVFKSIILKIKNQNLAPGALGLSWSNKK